jgi:hypothetical protein
MEVVDALMKARDVQLDKARSYQDASDRFQLLRVVATLLVAGIVVSYDAAGERQGSRADAFDQWSKSEFFPHAEEFDDRFTYADFRQRTELARRHISSIVTPEIMDRAMAPSYGTDTSPEERRLGRAFYFLKKERYKLDPFLTANISDLAQRLEHKRVKPLADQLQAVKAELKALNIYANHPGIQEDIEKLLASANTVGEFVDALVKRFEAVRKETEGRYAEEIAKWREMDQLDRNWFAWRYSLWSRLEDSSYEKFHAALAALGDQGVLLIAALHDGDNFKSSVMKIRDEVQALEDKIRKESETEVTVGSVVLYVPKKLLLGLFPFLFLLASVASRILKLRARSALIWLAAFDRRIEKQVGPLNAPTASPEVLNADGVLDYARKKQFALLFDNDPSLLSNAMYATTTWLVASYVFWCWGKLCWSFGPRWFVGLLCSLVAMWILSTVAKSLLAGQVIGQTLRDTGVADPPEAQPRVVAGG